MNNKELASAVRKLRERVAELIEDLYEQGGFESHSVASEDLRDTKDLLGVLAHIVDGKPVEKAFGAPGDWGYHTPIGKALAGTEH